MKTKHGRLKQFNRSALIGIYRKPDFQAVWRENIWGLFRPFHKADSTAVQHIFDPCLNGLFPVFDPVKINMVDLLTARDRVFIDQGKSWTAHGVRYMFDITKGMHKTGFTRSHMAMHGDHPAITNSIPKPSGGIMYAPKVELILPVHRCKIHENPLKHHRLIGNLGV
jgi:hypothetical protein